MRLLSGALKAVTIVSIVKNVARKNYVKAISLASTLAVANKAGKSPRK